MRQSKPWLNSRRRLSVRGARWDAEEERGVARCRRSGVELQWAGVGPAVVRLARLTSSALQRLLLYPAERSGSRGAKCRRGVEVEVQVGFESRFV